ncbi:insulinase family protein [Patescibacteria group bacterium]|nr:insulinase family protein [Patescibacteria group bacterium]
MKYKRTLLKNGLRVLTVPVAGTQTVTVIVMVGVGSRYETEKEAGLSHFVEHMFFKGTAKRPTTLDISEELDAVGGEFNAFTAKDKTLFYAKVDAKHFEIALDVVADIFLNSKIEVKEIEKEKGTILQELNMYEDTPVRNVADIFENLLYGGNSLGQEIIGNKKTIQAFKRENFTEYLKNFYVADNTLICVAGKFDEKKSLKAVEKYFFQMRKNKIKNFFSVKDNQCQPAVRIKFKKTDQTHFILGTRAYPENHSKRFALALLSVILGGNMSSRLFIEVREKLGLAYYVKTEIEAYADCGYLATQVGVEHKNLELTIKTILKEYQKMANFKVSEKELQKAKEFIKGKSLMGLEASDEVAMFFASQEIKKKKILTPSEIFTKIDKVTPSDILKVAQEIFLKKRLNLAIIGPHKNALKIKTLLN